MTESSVLPKHVGIILDGNRRWAKAKGKPTMEGHQAGAEVFKEIATAAYDRGISYLSIYAFSMENWSRTQEEISFLMKLFVKALKSYLDEFHERNVRLRILGRRDRLDKNVLQAIEEAEAKTASNTKGTLAVCFNYGGREEIADALQALQTAGVPAAEVTPEAITDNLYAPDVPDVDLLIRTSGERRLSGFMLWRSAYAEYYFSDKLWPDFTVSDLDLALADYASRQRRFGS